MASSLPSRILFGSCNNQNLTQPLWPVIESRKAAAFVWGGDAIYADINLGINTSGFPPRPEFSSATPERLDLFYATQLRNPGYATFLQISKNTTTVFGTLDDHDFGLNNGDQTFIYAREAGMAFLKFTNESKQSPMWKRAEMGYGVYGVKTFDFSRPKGQELLSDEESATDPDALLISSKHSNKILDKTVAVFVLDCRTNKTPWHSSANRKRPYPPTADFLGKRQWHWFETAIRNSRASVNVVVNGLQVHPLPRLPDANLAESWSHFPHAQKRLYNTILNSGAEAPVLISGDVHMAQLMRRDCYKTTSSETADDWRRSLIEITTSGMTHSWGTCASPQVRHHTRWYSFYARFASSTLMTVCHTICPFLDLVTSSRIESRTRSLYENGGAEGAKRGKQFSLELNFGELQFDWEERTLTARIIGESGATPPLIAAKWSLEQLSGRINLPGGEAKAKQISYLKKYIWGSEPISLHEFTCVNHRGHASHIRSMASHAVGWATFSILLSAPISIPIALLVFVCFKIKRKFRGVRVETYSQKKQK